MVKSKLPSFFKVWHSLTLQIHIVVKSKLPSFFKVWLLINFSDTHCGKVKTASSQDQTQLPRDCTSTHVNSTLLSSTTNRYHYTHAVWHSLAPFTPVGVLTHWSSNPLEFKPTGVQTHWSSNPLEFKPTGVLTHWSSNPLEF